MTFEVFFSNDDNCLRLIVIFLSIGQLLTSIEYFYLILQKEYSENGYFPWRIIQLDKIDVKHRTNLQIIVHHIYSDLGIRILIILRIACFLGIIISPQQSILSTVCLFLLVLQNIIFQYRNSYGGDGSDQMSMILIISLFLGNSFFSSNYVSKACLIFIAAQTCLSYVSAGIAKLVSKKWRSGAAVFDIFNTGSYGHTFVAKFLSNKKMLSFVFSWIVIIMECLFPISLFLNSQLIFFSFLLWGVLFHFFNALIMGLNSFFWIFIATYPSLLFVYFTLL